MKKESFYQKNKEYCKLKNKEYRIKNKELLKKKAAEYYIKNRNRILKEYHNNKEHHTKRWREWRLKNIDKLKKKYEENKSIRRIQLREKWKNDKQHRLKSILSHKVRQGIKRYGNGKKYFSSLELIGCSIPELINKLESEFIDDMNWSNYGIKGWHIDHIKPLCSFNLSIMEEQKKCFHYTNLQPLWATDNIRKGGKFNE